MAADFISDDYDALVDMHKYNSICSVACDDAMCLALASPTRPAAVLALNNHSMIPQSRAGMAEFGLILPGRQDQQGKLSIPHCLGPTAQKLCLHSRNAGCLDIRPFSLYVTMYHGNTTQIATCALGGARGCSPKTAHSPCLGHASCAFKGGRNSSLP